MITKCPHCNTKFKVRDEYKGKKTKCTKCSQPFTIAEFTAKPSPSTGETDVDKKKVEVCAKCGKTIGKLEKSYPFKGVVVCAECDGKLRKSWAEYYNKKRRKVIVGVAILVVSTLFICFRIFSPSVTLLVHEILVGKSEKNVMVSPNGRRVAIIERRGQKLVFIVDGVESKEYDVDPTFSRPRLSEDHFLFSPDSERFMHMARRGKKKLVVVDGVEQKEHDSVYALTFSPDSKRFAYLAIDDFQKDSVRKMRIIVDGVEGKEYYWYSGIVHDICLTFSPNSKHVAYAVRVGSEWKVVVDGVEGKGYRALDGLTFSPDSRSLAYRASIRRGAELVVVDGTQGREYDRVSKPMFFPSTGEVVYAAERSGKWVLVVGGVEGKEYDGIAAKFVKFSPDGERFAYPAIRAEKTLMVIDGSDGKEYDDVSTPVFSPDSKRIAYVAIRDGKHSVILDGVPGNPYDGISALGFSPDSRRVAYVAERSSNRFAVVDGVEQKEYDSIGNLTFSPDSKQLVYMANFGRKKPVPLDDDDYRMLEIPTVEYRRGALPKITGFKQHRVLTDEATERIFKGMGKWCIVRDGIQGKTYDGVANVTFTPDSKHIIYWAKDDDIWTIVVDSVEKKKYDSFVSDGRSFPKPQFYHDEFVFDNATTFRTLANRDSRMFILEVTIVKDWW